MHEPLFTIKPSERLTGKRVKKMKTFTDTDPVDVEKKVNDWLQLNDVELLYAGQSQSEKSGRFVFTVSLFYQTV